MAEPFRRGALPTLPGAPTSLPINPGFVPTAPSQAELDRQMRELERHNRQRALFESLQTQDTGVNLRYTPSAWQAWMATQGKGFQEGPLGTFNPLALGRPVGENFLPSRSLTNGMGFGPAPIGSKTFNAGAGFWSGALNPAELSGSAMGAIMGGGNVGGSLGGSLGGSIASKAMSTVAGKAIGSLVGGALGSVIPVFGTMLGAWAGGAVGKLFGGSEESKKVNQPREEFFAKMGGLEKLNPMLQQATGGVQLAQNLFNAKTEKDSKAAMEAITQALEIYTEKLQIAESALLGVAAKSEHITSITPAMREAMASALEAKNVDDYTAAMGELNTLFDEQLREQQLLDDTMKKYGLTWKDLGKEAKAAKVAEITKGITEEFKILKGAGVDANLVMSKMGPQINDIVKEARKSGIEIPKSFREVIQVAIDAGQVFDDNGQKITEMTATGVTFGEDITDVTRELADTMKELARVLKETLGSAFVDVRKKAQTEIGQIPRDIDIDVNYESHNKPDSEESHSGSIIRAWGLERFHRGGLLPDERVIIGQTGEGILNRGAMARLGSAQFHALNRGGGLATGDGGTVVVNVHVAGSVTTEHELARTIQKQIDRTYQLKRPVRAA